MYIHVRAIRILRSDKVVGKGTPGSETFDQV